MLGGIEPEKELFHILKTIKLARLSILGGRLPVMKLLCKYKLSRWIDKLDTTWVDPHRGGYL